MGGRAVCVAMAAALAAGCAGAPVEGQLIADPYEGVNRAVHGFNVGVDQVVLRPASQAYDFVAPALVKHLVSNAVDHIQLPVHFFNYVLQGDVDSALVTFGRFGVNTLAGAGGLLDPATEVGLPNAPTDFGLTLAKSGAEEGVYIVLPLFGPSTTRDTVGRVVDIGLNPLTYVTPGSGSGEIALIAVENGGPPIVVRHRNFELIDELLYETEDSYVALRTAYVLNRRSRAIEGGVDVERLPDIFAD